MCRVLVSCQRGIRNGSHADACRGKYIGIIGGVISLGYALGPLIGGALSEKASWRVSIIFHEVAFLLTVV